jgi:hypothetical protein|nr:MAG TPA: hypothetical protein [Caudoviricetes sp.]
MIVLFAVAAAVLGAYWVGLCEGVENGYPWGRTNKEEKNDSDD